MASYSVRNEAPWGNSGTRPFWVINSFLSTLNLSYTCRFTLCNLEMNSFDSTKWDQLTIFEVMENNRASCSPWNENCGCQKELTWATCHWGGRKGSWKDQRRGSCGLLSIAGRLISRTKRNGFILFWLHSYQELGGETGGTERRLGAKVRES